MPKLDLKAITEYSNAYSHKLCNDFFENKDTISGAEILNISAIDQVNLFTIKALYENWRTITQQFKSPFFDFSNEKVKVALKDFMNIASQHISVKKDHFQPLLSKATSETLALALNPQEYFDGLLRDLPEFKCTKQDLALLLKYNRINTGIIQTISEKMAIDDFVFTNQALKWLEEAVNSAGIDDDSEMFDALNQVLTCDRHMFLKSTNSTKTEMVKKTESDSFFDQISPEENIKIDIKSIEKQASKPLKVINETPKKEELAPPTLNDQYQTNSPTYNDHLKPSDSPTLVDLHQNAPVKSLAGAISLNQKFVFINKLFNGDSKTYAETIEILEKSSNSAEAINLLKYKYAPKYQWNLNSDEADELIDILNRML